MTAKWCSSANPMNTAVPWHYEHDGQRKLTKYTVPQVDKGTSLHCYYVKMCRTGEYACDTCSTHFYTIAVKGCSFVYLDFLKSLEPFLNVI